MVLTALTLRQFRSYTKAAFTFSPHITLVVGQNAIGKTNLLESIYLMATGKSFRADYDREVIRWSEEFASIECRLTGASDSTDLKLMLTAGDVGGKSMPLKRYLVNGIPRRQIDFVGNLRAVLFWPEHLELVTDSPSVRRRYLDSVLVQVDREYRRNLLSYERGLRQRNRLLDLINEGKASRSQLLFWNQLLIKAGGYLTNKRAEFIDFINSCQLHEVSYQLIYDKSVISESRLTQYQTEEIAAKATLVGPHRDDMQFQMKHAEAFVELSKYGSRGEERLAILWLKLAEVSFIESKTEARPLLLLDDIFSELDDDHRKLVLDAINRQQTILTTADPDMIPRAIQRKASVIQL